MLSLPPQLTAPRDVIDALALRGFAVVGAVDVAAQAGVDVLALQALSSSGKDLPEEEQHK